MSDVGLQPSLSLRLYLLWIIRVKKSRECAVFTRSRSPVADIEVSFGRKTSISFSFCLLAAPGSVFSTFARSLKLVRSLILAVTEGALILRDCCWSERSPDNLILAVVRSKITTEIPTSSFLTDQALLHWGPAGLRSSCYLAIVRQNLGYQRQR